MVTDLGAQTPQPPKPEGSIEAPSDKNALATSPLDDHRPISLNFQNVEISTLLQVFAEFTGLNLVATDSVKGQVTVRLNDVPWPQALNIVLQSKVWLRVRTGECCGWPRSTNGPSAKKCSSMPRPRWMQ